MRVSDRKPGLFVSLAVTTLLAASAIGFFVVPSAATVSDGDVVLGVHAGGSCSVGTSANCEADTTGIFDTTSGNVAFAVGEIGGAGSKGVEGVNYGAGYAFWGYSASGNAVYATSEGSDSIVGDLLSGSTGVNAVTGTAGNGMNGVNAESNSPYTIGQNGHYNAALFAQDTSTGTSLWARNLNNGGWGGYIEAYGAKSIALKVCGCSGAKAMVVSGPSSFSGPTSFSRSGTLTVAAGHAYVTKTSISLSSASLVLATIQGNVTGVFMQGVTKVAGSSGSFTIHLNKATPVNLTVAWFILG